MLEDKITLKNNNKTILYYNFAIYKVKIREMLRLLICLIVKGFKTFKKYV